MKKGIVLGLCVLTMVGCKEQSEEVKLDETKMEMPIDSITPKDSVVINENNESETVDKPAVPTNTPATVSSDKPAFKYAAFGSKITADKALSKEQMLNKYVSMKKGDTINVKFKSNISSVCKKKGCWMKMDLAENKESFVKFKDYGFFVPLNADNSEAIVSGKAFLDVISVDELKHYAQDGGKSQEEIDKIKDPKVTYAFQADGVLIQE